VHLYYISIYWVGFDQKAVFYLIDCVLGGPCHGSVTNLENYLNTETGKTSLQNQRLSRRLFINYDERYTI
jgi:hypothetical protein